MESSTNNILKEFKLRIDSILDISLECRKTKTNKNSHRSIKDKILKNSKNTKNSKKNSLIEKTEEIGIKTIKREEILKNNNISKVINLKKKKIF